MVKNILHLIKDFYESDRDETACDAEQQIKEQFVVRNQVIIGLDNCRMIAQITAGNSSCKNGGNDDGAELTHAETADDDLQCEHDAAERRIEYRRNATRCAACHKGSELIAGELEKLSDSRTHRCADLDNRSFATGSAAGADAERRRNGFGEHERRFDIPAFRDHGFHHVGYAVPFGFRIDFVEYSHRKPADSRQNDNNIFDPRIDGEQPLKFIEEKNTDNLDRIVKNHGAETSRHADDRCDDEKKNILGEV